MPLHEPLEIEASQEIDKGTADSPEADHGHVAPNDRLGAPVQMKSDRKSRAKAYEALPGNNQHCARSYISSVAPNSAVAFAIGTGEAVIARRSNKGRANRDFTSPPKWAMTRSCGASSGRLDYPRS